MRRAREAQLARLAARATVADDAAAWHGAALRARVKVGAALRQALEQSGIDPATVAMLRICDEAARELAETPDRPEQHPAAPPIAGDRRHDLSAAPLEARIDRLVRRYRDRPGIDLAQASLAEALAWSLARLSPAEPFGISDGPGASSEAAPREAPEDEVFS
jgi:hypothetical protein